MGLTGNVAKLAQLKARIRDLPRTVAQGVAKQGAPAMTQLTRQAYDGGRTVYGDARPVGVNGQVLTLNKSGATSRELRFEAIGTVIRCKLGPKWAPYLIGKYSILPNGGLPAAFAKRLREIVAAAETP